MRDLATLSRHVKRSHGGEWPHSLSPLSTAPWLWPAGSTNPCRPTG